MLSVLNEFRRGMEELMLPALHRRVLLYGYESYTGRFIKWYAKYYHNIDIDYLVSTDMSRGRAYDQEIFRPSVIDFSYKDVNGALIWVAEPLTEETHKYFEQRGYVKNKTYFDFYEKIYGRDIYEEEVEGTDIFHKRKVGKRDIQFLEWLEWKRGCNFVTRIPHDFLENGKEHAEGYACTTQKEIFPILDHCHCIPKAEDAIFDFGCGKGAALVSFLDYGFDRVGGVEFEAKIYDVLQDNMKKLDIDDTKVELLFGDAAKIEEELDSYNWFYFYNPFDEVILKKCADHIANSYRRNKRKMHIIFFSPKSYTSIEETGVFRLTNQFTVDMRQRVVGIFESYE